MAPPKYTGESISFGERYPTGSKVRVVSEGPDASSWKVAAYRPETGQYGLKRPSAAPGGSDFEWFDDSQIEPVSAPGETPMASEASATPGRRIEVVEPPLETASGEVEPQTASALGETATDAAHAEPQPAEPAPPAETIEPDQGAEEIGAHREGESTPRPIGVWRSAQGTDREADFPVLEILSGPHTERGEEYIQVRIQTPDGEQNGYIQTKEFLEGNPDDLAGMTLSPAPEMPQPAPASQPEPSPEPLPIEPAPTPEPAPIEPVPTPEPAPIEPVAEPVAEPGPAGPVEAATEPETEEEESAAQNNPPADLSPENKNFFAKMSERGKRLSRRLYEGSYKTIGVDKIRGRLDLTYNQFWADRYQRKAVKFKGEMDGLSARIDALDISKAEIESVIEGLRQQHLPGAERLQLKIQDIEREKMELLNKKDVVQSELEAMDNQAKLYTNERDKILDGHISKYDERLKPMEKKLEALQTSRDEVELLVAVMQAKHKDQQVKLEEIENRKEQTEEALRKAGMSEKEVMAFAATKELERILSETRARMAAEQEELNARMTEVNKKIAKEDAKANPYRDKRERYVRLKGSRPIKVKVPARQRGEASTTTEQTTAHTREAAEATVGGGGDQVGAAERTATPDNRPTVEGHLGRWNGLLGRRFGEEAQAVDLNDFLNATKLVGDYRLNSEDFANIVEKYAKLKKLPVRQLNKTKKDFSG